VADHLVDDLPVPVGELTGGLARKVMAGEDHGGWLVAAGPATTLQPGTHYRLGPVFSVNGAPSCSFGATRNDPTLSWAGVPVPS
jgi:hypothetical protein